MPILPTDIRMSRRVRDEPSFTPRETPIMKRYPFALAALALFGAAAVQAQTVYPTPVTPGMNNGMGNTGNIANHKQAEMAKIQQKMQILQQLQSCVSAAQTSDAIRQCNQTAHAEAGSHPKKC
jgi:hypothetical protein